MRLVKVFFWGMLVSFLGSLPLGTLNVAAMQISVQESIRNAMYFSLGSLLTEMIYVRISLVGINWIRKQKVLFKWMEWIAFGIVLALAVGSFIAATHENHAKNVMLNNNMHRFVLGLLLSAISPMQIPFWFGWSTVLFSKNILQPKNSFYNFYILGIGLGTLLGNCVFIFGGKYIVQRLNANQSILNLAIGSIFAITAVIMLIRILMHKDAVQKISTMEERTG
ncbi:lysine transporter LysE [Ginsengibacter hankyongi]|uniref:Lysine transporter LysE n=1 Tax=Ginsengibacter hankyongi TaxID=2607284 RepID=A0A5J5IF48_9BACT|nr:LysE family transporter [Ginsengibacter hankyongi]KAA9038648.1 lysine transporter LysE [Ginsengibacter hankyongi]